MLLTPIPAFMPKAAATYTGPGDIVSGALAWWGLRAYNAAYATGSNPCIDILDSSAGNAATINITSAGDLDLATLTTWIGLHGTAYISKIYDQTGNAFHLTATANSNSTVATSVIGSLPAILDHGFTNNTCLAITSGLSQATPFVISCVVNRPVNPGIFADVFYSNAGNVQVGFTVANDTIFIYDGSTVSTISATDNAFHAIQFTYNGASSEIYLDGTGTAKSQGSPSLSGKMSFNGVGVNPYSGYRTEEGVWAGTMTSGQKSSLNSNQHTYWGF